MIVKNEEDCIGRCLASVKDVVDEIIIVDTGSKDGTIRICESFGAKIYQFPWNGSFADARNFGIERASGDWILWLDADEEFDSADAGQLRKQVQEANYDIIAIHLINFYGDKADMDKVSEIAHHRLFRNGMNIKFINKIHEVLHAPEKLKLKENGRIGFLDSKLYHYGYMNQVVAKKDKHKRNLELLEKEIEMGEATPWTHYYIAAEYYQMKKYNEAFINANLSIFEFLKIGHIPPPSILYKLKYSILVNTGSWEGAWPGIEKAVAIFPDYVELWYLKGIILYQKKDYKKALKAFDECLKLGETNLDYLIVKGIGSFHALFFKGQCLEELHATEKALTCYLEALCLSETHEHSISALKNLLPAYEKDIRKIIQEKFDAEAGERLTEIIQSIKLS